ncbi:3-hydroxypropionyl-coenzyme A dehydratase [Armadillidium vulgare]|nr:3-hydroxypropionyl-coenzyme A dehydratase [Armadillidium vulgare]
MLKLKLLHKNIFRLHKACRLKLAKNISTGCILYQDTKESKLVTTEQIRGIRIITINRPEKRNCINIATSDALLQAFKDFDNDEDSKVAVLHGAGGNFCAGYDLQELSSMPDPMSLLNRGRGPMGPTHYETSKPVIAAIEGYAVAGGLELALWCDIRIVEETSIMGVYCRRFGVPLVDGGTSRLPAIVGLGRALDLILTGRPIRPDYAMEIGLANSVTACGSALGNAVFYAESLEKYPPEALRADRESARRFYTFSSLEEALKNETDRAKVAIEEARIGASRFVKGDGRHGSFKFYPGDPSSDPDSSNK